MATGVLGGDEDIADGAFQVASGRAAIGFHVASLGFDRASPAEVDDLSGSQSPACAADQDTGLAFVMAPVTEINDFKLRAPVCEDLDFA